MTLPTDPQPPTIKVGIAIVRYEQSLLVGVRPETTDLAGLHEFPGGKCHADESAAECAIRECAEETGLRVEVEELLLHNLHEYEHRTVDLSFFLCRPLSASQQPLAPFVWVPIQELSACRFPDGNREVLQLVRDRFHEQPNLWA